MHVLEHHTCMMLKHEFQLTGVDKSVESTLLYFLVLSTVSIPSLPAKNRRVSILISNATT